MASRISHAVVSHNAQYATSFIRTLQKFERQRSFSHDAANGNKKNPSAILITIQTVIHLCLLVFCTDATSEAGGKFMAYYDKYKKIRVPVISAKTSVPKPGCDERNNLQIRFKCNPKL